jgi:hypothetical protein
MTKNLGNVVGGIAFLATMVFASAESNASGFALVEEPELIRWFTHICVVDVETVELKNNTKVLKNGDVLNLSKSSLVSGVVVESLKGDCGAGVFTTMYTTPQGVEYNDDGEIVGYYTLLETETGQEMKVQASQRYIFGYLSWQEENALQQHDRVNLIDDLDNIQSIINDQLRGASN